MSMTRFRLHASSAGPIVAVVVTVSLLSGCGDTTAKGKSAADEQADGAAAEFERPDENLAIETKPPARKKKAGKTKGTHIGEIPLDVWPEVWLKDPLSVAS